MKWLKPIKIALEYQSNDYTKMLEQEINVLKLENKMLKMEVNDAVNKYGYELHINSELCDILHDHGIWFRPSANNSKYLLGSVEVTAPKNKRVVE